MKFWNWLTRRREGYGWPGYLINGRIRTSTAALVLAFFVISWVHNTYQPPAPAPVVPEATQVVPPGFMPDPEYTWVPRTNVEERPRTTTRTTSTPTTTTTTETSPTETTGPTETTSGTSTTGPAPTTLVDPDGPGPLPPAPVTSTSTPTTLATTPTTVSSSVATPVPGLTPSPTPLTPPR